MMPSKFAWVILAMPLPVFSMPNKALFSRCAPTVAPLTLDAVIQTESAGNPLAIAMVAGHIKQPTNLADAIATVKTLDAQGKNYSIGLMQVNKQHFAHFGLTPKTAFDPCNNLRVGSAILAHCFQSAKAAGTYPDNQHALRAALSCYYSGNFKRGFLRDTASHGRFSYVGRINHIVNTRYSVPAIQPLNTTNSNKTNDDEVSDNRQAVESRPSESWDAFGDFNSRK